MDYHDLRQIPAIQHEAQLYENHSEIYETATSSVHKELVPGSTVHLKKPGTYGCPSPKNTGNVGTAVIRRPPVPLTAIAASSKGVNLFTLIVKIDSAAVF